MALRLRQPAFTVATTTTTILVAIILVDSYILINPYLPVSLGHDVGDLASARMTAVGNNNLYVTWNDYLAGKHDILLAKSTDGGNSFGKSINVSNNAGLSIFPKIAVSTNNTLYVSWTDNISNARQNQNLHFAKSTDSGSSFIIQPVNIAREDVLGIPAIAASEKTNLYIIWAANFTGNYVIHFTHSTDSGNSFSAPVNLTSRNGQSSSPQIYPSKNGPYMVWAS